MDGKIDITQLRKLFEEMGLPSEGVHEKYFSMEIPASTNYATVKKKLIELEMNGIIAYAEPCLSSGHRSQLEGSR